MPRQRWLQFDGSPEPGYDSGAADLLFEIVTRRYQRVSTLLSSNKPFADGHELFPIATSVVTLIDRLPHHAEILLIEGESYRLKEARDTAEARLQRRTQLKRPKNS